MENKAKEIRMISLREVKINPKNRNKHTPEQIQRLKQIIEYQGFRTPVVISNRSGRLVAGHGRYLAAQELGMTQIPAIFQDFDSDEQEYAAGVSDNSIAAWAELDLSGINTDLPELGPDFDIDLLGIKDFVLDLAEKGEPGCDEDEVPEKPEARTKLGDLYQLGEHRLLCGDSTKREDVERLMNGEKANLWLTDPPYGVRMQAREESPSSSWVNKDRVHSAIENDDKTPDEMKVFWKAAAQSAHFATADNASYYWFSCQGGNQMMMMMMLVDAQWQVKHELIWVKDQMCFGRADYHYKHEPIIYGWKRKNTHEWFGDRCQVSTLECPRPKKSDLHPTMKPIELLERLINNSSTQKHVVLDTFCGSGSTLIACEKTGRKCYGMEIDPHYCDVIITRWEKYTGRKAELLGKT